MKSSLNAVKFKLSHSNRQLLAERCGGISYLINERMKLCVAKFLFCWKRLLNLSILMNLFSSFTVRATTAACLRFRSLTSIAVVLQMISMSKNVLRTFRFLFQEVQSCLYSLYYYYRAWSTSDRIILMNFIGADLDLKCSPLSALIHDKSRTKCLKRTSNANVIT